MHMHAALEAANLTKLLKVAASGTACLKKHLAACSCCVADVMAVVNGLPLRSLAAFCGTACPKLRSNASCSTAWPCDAARC